jgi:enoyl-CoA hydratase/carnithine racemase
MARSKRRSQLPFCLAPSRVALILALACVPRLAEIAADIGTALRALASTKIHSNAADSSFSTVSWEINMSDIITEHSGNILRIQLNRPARKNAMTLAMYITLADLLNATAKDDQIRVVLWHGAGDSFSAGNDIQDFLKNPPGPGESPQARLIQALTNFDKPIVAAVQGAAIGGGTTMLTHCDFVFAGESAKFQMPFVNLAVVPEFGTSYSVPARIGYLRAAELILLGSRFDAKRATELGLVTRVVPDQELLATATETARQLAEKAPAALQACKRLMRTSTREQLERAVKLENEEFSKRVRSAEAKEAFTAFLEKRRPNFSSAKEPPKVLAA